MPRGRYCYCPHFADEETDPQKVCTKSHCQGVTELQLKLWQCDCSPASRPFRPTPLTCFTLSSATSTHLCRCPCSWGRTRGLLSRTSFNTLQGLQSGSKSAHQRSSVKHQHARPSQTQKVSRQRRKVPLRYHPCIFPNWDYNVLCKEDFILAGDSF